MIFMRIIIQNKFSEVYTIGPILATEIVEDLLENVNKTTFENWLNKKKPEHIRDFGMLLVELAISTLNVQYDSLESKYEPIIPDGDEPVNSLILLSV